jgi:uncharacterized membrane protein YkoI
MKKFRIGLRWAGALILVLGSTVMVTGQQAQAATKKEAPLNCSIKIPQPAPADLATLAKITAQDALTTAEKAYPGMAVKQVELDNENGCLVYSIELSNGGEVLVDAGNGKVLRREPPAAEHGKHEAGETD